MVGERGVTLSGGQKQRVAIARTLLKNPKILILDDATSSVDMETEASIRRALDKLMTDRTTFVIAHRTQSVMTADQILVLKNGQVMQHGTHESLTAEPGLLSPGLSSCNRAWKTSCSREISGDGSGSLHPAQDGTASDGSSGNGKVE